MFEIPTFGHIILYRTRVKLILFTRIIYLINKETINKNIFDSNWQFSDFFLLT